eukprot:UN00260
MSTESKENVADTSRGRKAKIDDSSEMNIIYAGILVLFVVIGGWFVLDVDFSYYYYYYLALCIFVMYLFAFVL